MRSPLLILAGLLLLLLTVFSLADEPPVNEPGAAKATPEIEAFLIPAAEEKYAAEVAKAAAHVSKAKQVAAEVRLKAYRDELSKFTKAGDFDRAIAIKERIKQIEGDTDSPSSKPRPKETVRFGGHRYALFREPVTWHVAKKRCEMMGGHIVVLDSSGEIEWFQNLCRSQKVSCWVGATEEEVEGKWRWINGNEVNQKFMKSVTIDNANDSEHWLVFNFPEGRWHDTSHRMAFVCEWDE